MLAYFSSLEASGNSLFFLRSVLAMIATSSPCSFTIGSLPTDQPITSVNQGSDTRVHTQKKPTVKPYSQSHTWAQLNCELLTASAEIVQTVKYPASIWHYIDVVERGVSSLAQRVHASINNPRQPVNHPSSSSSSSLFRVHHQCVAPLAANSPHSGLSRAISTASSKVRSCRDRSFFRVAIHKEWGRPTGLLQSLWGTAVRIVLASADSWLKSILQASNQISNKSIHQSVD